MSPGRTPRTPPYQMRTRVQSSDDNIMKKDDKINYDNSHTLAKSPINSPNSIFDNNGELSQKATETNTEILKQHTGDVEKLKITFGENENNLSIILDEIDTLLLKEKIGVKDLTAAVKGLYNIVSSIVNIVRPTTPTDESTGPKHLNVEHDGYSQLVETVVSQNNKIDKMQSLLDDHERDRRQCNLVISGLPASKSASDMDAILVMANHLNINRENILFVNRMINKSKQDRIPPLLVSFCNRSSRNIFYKAYLNVTETFNLLDLGLGATKKRIFVNEHLCKKQHDIFRSASSYKQQHKDKIKRVTTRGGYVYIQTIQNTELKRIVNSTDIEKICNPSQQAAS